MTAAASNEADVEVVHRSLRTTGKFVYAHSARLVAVSVCWFVCSLPLLTIGPATLGAYTAIRSLEVEDGRGIDFGAVLASLKRNGFNALLLGCIPGVFGSIAVLYLLRYARTGSAASGILTVVSVYAGFFSFLVVVSTLVFLADGDDFVDAIGAGYRWVTQNPIRSTLTGVLSGLLLLVGSISTIGLVIIVPAVVFCFQLNAVSAGGNSPAVSTGESPASLGNSVTHSYTRRRRQSFYDARHRPLRTSRTRYGRRPW